MDATTQPAAPPYEILPWGAVVGHLAPGTSPAMFVWAISYGLRMHPDHRSELLDAVVAHVEADPASALPVVSTLEGAWVFDAAALRSAWSGVREARSRLRALLGSDERRAREFAAHALVFVEGPQVLAELAPGSTGSSLSAWGVPLAAALRLGGEDEAVVEAALAIVEGTGVEEDDELGNMVDELAMGCGIDLEAYARLMPPSDPDAQDSWRLGAIDSLGGRVPRRLLEKIWRGVRRRRLDEAVDELVGLCLREETAAAQPEALLASRLLEALRERAPLRARLAREVPDSLAGLALALAGRRVGLLRANPDPATAQSALEAAEAVRHLGSPEQEEAVASTLLRWSRRGPEAAPVAAALAALGTAPLDADVWLGELVSFVSAHPSPLFLEMVDAVWRPGDGPLSALLEVLLGLYRPEDERLEGLAAAVEAWREESDDGATVSLRLRCRGCGGVHWYGVTKAVLAFPDEVPEDREPRTEDLVVDEHLVCKRCGRPEDLAATEDALRSVLVLGQDAFGEGGTAPPWLEVARSSFTLLDGGSLDRAREVYGAALKARPDDRNLLLDWGDSLALFRRTWEVLAVAEEFLERHPGDGDVRILRSEMLGRLDRAQEGLDEFVAALGSSHFDETDPVDRSVIYESVGADLARLAGSSLPEAAVAALGRLAARRRAVAPGGGPAAEAARTKVGRNDPCPCGSGKKYKKCCLAAERV